MIPCQSLCFSIARAGFACLRESRMSQFIATSLRRTAGLTIEQLSEFLLKLRDLRWGRFTRMFLE